jgi:hypothetical protein
MSIGILETEVTIAPTRSRMEQLSFVLITVNQDFEPTEKKRALT